MSEAPRLDRRHSCVIAPQRKISMNPNFMKRKMSLAVVTKHQEIPEKPAEPAKKSFKPGQVSSRYFWMRTRPPKTHEELHSKNVEIYLAKLKASRPKREKEFNMREMRWNEIPEGLSDAWTELGAPRVPGILNAAFDDTGFYRTKQIPLSSVLTDMAVTRNFKAYLEQNKERVSDTLRAPFEVSQPLPATARAPRRKFQ